jgi:hypothetical protein
MKKSFSQFEMGGGANGEKFGESLNNAEKKRGDKGHDFFL